jgi:hypothetical protein
MKRLALVGFPDVKSETATEITRRVEEHVFQSAAQCGRVPRPYNCDKTRQDIAPTAMESLTPNIPNSNS